MKINLRIVFIVLFLSLGTCIAVFLSLFNSAHNHLTVLYEDIRTSWCQIENVYRRRADIVPRIITVMAQYSKNEKPLLNQIAEETARDVPHSACDGEKCVYMLSDSAAFDAFQKQQDVLERNIQKLIAVSEHYPELQANIHFRILMMHLKSNTHRIIGKKKRYNNLVQSYNTTIGSLTYSLPASFYGFDKKEYLVGDEIEKTHTLLP